MADDKNLGEEMARMHIGGLRDLGIIPPEAPTETDWVHACAAIVGVREYYKHIAASESAMQSIALIERCLRYAADVVHTTPPEETAKR